MRRRRFHTTVLVAALAVVSVAAGVFAGSSGPASAQSTSAGTAIPVAASSAGIPPSGVAGIRVGLVCRDLATAVAVTGRSVNVALGATATVFLEVVAGNATTTPVVPASSCQITATMIGTSGINSGLLSISVDGVDRTGLQGFDGTGAATAVSATVSGSTSSPYVTVTPASSIAIIVRYPVFILRNAVAGAEPVENADYLYMVECFAVPVVPFIAPTTLGGYQPGDLVVADRGFVTLPIAGVPTRVFDATATVVLAPDVRGSAEVLATLYPPTATRSTIDQVGSALYTALALPVRPGSLLFTLRRGGSRAISATDVPGLTTSSSCRFIELDAGGASAISSSVGGAYEARGGASVFATTLAPLGSTVTLTNSFYGGLAVRVSVSGDDGRHIRTFLVQVRCDSIGINDTFLLKGGQTKVYDHLLAGASCIVLEPKTDGAVLQVIDSSGPAVSDGVVIIPAERGGCGTGYRVLNVGGATVVNGPGVLTDDVCIAWVTLANRYSTPSTR